MSFNDDYPDLAELIPIELQSAIYNSCLSREKVRDVIMNNFDNGLRELLFKQLNL